MSDLPQLETLLSFAVFAIPIAVFLVLVALLWRRRGKGGPPRTFGVAQPVALRKTGADAEAIPVEPAALDAPALITRIDAASASGQTEGLAALYLDLAQAHRKTGDDTARMAALRSAAALGSQHGPAAVHARARVELAEAAYAAGDLTSACEQWQMARTAYLADGCLKEHAEVEKRMRENGCPTDWVLTDF